MTTKTINLTPDLYQYLCSISVHDTPELQELRELTKTLPGSMMQIAPEQGQFIALLIELIGAKKVLELGTFTGYSALVMAKALPDDGKLITCDICKESTQIAQQFWQKAGVQDKIELKLGEGLSILNQMISEGFSSSFDFIFIDADKSNYINYYHLAKELIRTGGLIAIDNVLWSGEVANSGNQDKRTKLIRQLNELIYHDSEVRMSLVPIGDGLTLVRKR